jgi:hypothetical protein
MNNGACHGQGRNYSTFWRQLSFLDSKARSTGKGKVFPVPKYDAMKTIHCLINHFAMKTCEEVDV